MNLIDDKFINLLSTRLEKFKKVKPGLYNCRCPICGDSKKNKSKARGYFYSIKSNTNYKCHNCGANLSFNNFLKKIDPILHKQFCLEKFKSGFTGKNFVVEEPKFNFDKPKFSKKLDLPKASENLIAKEYLEGRKLNSDKFYYTEKFKLWVNSIKQTFENVKYDEPRIIIPLFYNKELIGFQGRSLKTNPLVKYITIMLDEDAPKIYGLDNIQKDKTVYITEGPFDSEFISNCIALCGADGNVEELNIGDRVWIYDNEPRNLEIISRIEKCIDRGEKVVIWPSSIDKKDINQMYIAGLNVQDVVESNTYFGLEAKLKFTNWKKYEQRNESKKA
jgi:hypothetical protein